MSIKKILGVVLLAWAISTHSCCGSSCDNPSGSLTVESPVENCELRDANAESDRTCISGQCGCCESKPAECSTNNCN